MNVVVQRYAGGGELDRMTQPRNQVEWLRTCELLERWLPSAPARVADIGGGAGAYAAWLGRRHYETVLFDLTPLHVDAARSKGLAAHVADARKVPLEDEAMDAVLLLGPLYHLPAAGDRTATLQEVWRVLKPGGVVVAAAMSRWARVLVKAAEGLLADPDWHQHTLTMMQNGQAAGDGDWDVTYRHDPSELAVDVAAQGFRDVEVVGVEGPAGAWARRDPALNEVALELARVAEVAMAACSIHLLAKGVKPQR